MAVDWQHQAQQIELQGCSFSGTIPKEWFQFKELVRLNLAENFFTGTLPTEIGELGSGHTGMEDSTLGLFLYENFGLTGTIPSEIGILDELGTIDRTFHHVQYSTTPFFMTTNMHPRVSVLFSSAVQLTSVSKRAL